MSLTELTTTYLINLLFWLWVNRWGGAKWLEGSLLAGLLVNVFATRWSAEGIKLFGCLWLLITTILFVVALFVPDFRYFF